MIPFPVKGINILLCRNVMPRSVSLTSLLEKHILKEDIQDVNRGLGIRVSGTKDELIKALLSETDRSPKGTLRLFSKPILQDVCRKLGVSPSGTKEQIIARLVAAEQRPASNASRKAKGPRPKKERAEAAPVTEAPVKEELPAEDGKKSILKVRLIPKGQKKTAKP
ncbi:hypothetical protein AOA80_03160 [Methanomassiliicoccales archaeon RumEn M1]|nr:hypothetical protein AOA80_03160 [Methanomassiliicoccales archaeon RumEn M1]